MGKKHLICESGAGQHYSATAAVAAKFNMPLIGVMGEIDIKRVNQNIIKAKHYGAKLKSVPGSLKEAITFAIKFKMSIIHIRSCKRTKTNIYQMSPNHKIKKLR